jgi:hypothetical protein
MRKIHIKVLAVALAPLMILSCVKETDDNLDRQEKFYLNNPEAISQVKFVHAYTPLTLGGSPAQSTTGTTAMGFRITMDGNKINGAGNTSVTTNTFIYGGVFPGTTAYAFLPPGAHNFKFIMNRVANNTFAPVTGDEYLSTTVALAPGKKYSMFIADPYSTGYLVEDKHPDPPLNQYSIRFINVSAETSTRYDVASARHGLIFSNVGYKEMQDFKVLTIPAITDTLFLKTAGTNTIVFTLPTFTAASQRSYTVIARGKTGVTGRTPSIAIYTNR